MSKRDIATDDGKIHSDSLCTPPLIFEPLYEFWGRIPHCDPCTNKHALVRADRMLTSGGLVFPWGKYTYDNHPYSTNEPWIAKALQEMKAGRVQELVILCMTATSTAWWKRAAEDARRNPRILCTKRIKFCGPSGRPLKDTARFDTSLIYYGPKPARFDRYFAHVTSWSTWGR